MMEFKAVREFRETVDPDNDRIIVGYPAIFGNLDDGQDILHKGAMAKTLMESRHRVRWLWNHNHTAPPTAAILDIEEVGKEGLPARLLTDYPHAVGALRVKRAYLRTPRGDEILEAIRAGAVTEGSIAFLPLDFDFVDEKGQQTKRRMGSSSTRHLRTIRLFDCSDVNWGMNPATVNLKKVTPFQDYPLAPINRPWDGDAATTRLREKFGYGTDDMDWEAYGNTHLYHDATKPDVLGSYKLPYCDLIDEEIQAVPQGIFAAAASLQGARTEPDIPEDEIEKAKENLGKYYHKMERPAPWEREEMGLGVPFEVLGNLLYQVKAGRTISAASAAKAKAVVELLEQLLGEEVGGMEEMEKAKLPFLLLKGKLLEKGGEGSGHFGHAGRPGERGGSASAEGAPDRIDRTALDTIKEKEESLTPQDLPGYKKEVIAALSLDPKDPGVRRAGREAWKEAEDVGDFTTFRERMTEFAEEVHQPSKIDADALDSVAKREEDLTPADLPKYKEDVLSALGLNSAAADVGRASREAWKEVEEVGDFTIFREGMTDFAKEYHGKGEGKSVFASRRLHTSAGPREEILVPTGWDMLRLDILEQKILIEKGRR